MQKITLNADIKDGKITFDIQDFLELIQPKKEAIVECPKPKPQAMAFDSREELKNYVKNNPSATCRGIPTEELVKFIKENKGKLLFLKEANLINANLSGANLMWAYLRGADLRGTDLSGAYLMLCNLGGANFRDTILRGAFYDKSTKFPERFTIPKTMILQIN